MKTLSKEAEDKVMSSIEQVCSLVDDGSEPTAALKKVAEDNNLSSEFVKLVGHGYNTGAVTFQRESSSGILDKHASVDLADVESVVDALFNVKAETKAAAAKSTSISDEYAPGARIKRATAKKPAVKSAAAATEKNTDREKEKNLDGNTKYRRSIKFIDTYRVNEKRAREAYVDAQDKLMSKLSAFAAYAKFNKSALSTILSAAGAEYGVAGESVVKYACELYGFKIQPADMSKFAGVIDWQKAPYSIIIDAIEAGKEVNATKRAYAEACEATQLAVKKSREIFFSNEPEFEFNSEIKLAGIFDAAAAIGLNQSVRQLMTPKAPSDKVQDTALDLFDPDQEREIRAIQARAAVHDLMMNDEVLSGFEPEQIVNAYNEISAIAPRVSYRIGAMRPLLRKRLAQGYLEPFEISELAKLDNTLGKSEGMVRSTHTQADE